MNLQHYSEYCRRFANRGKQRCGGSTPLGTRDSLYLDVIDLIGGKDTTLSPAKKVRNIYFPELA
jgi:hypothetical protein